MPEKKAEPEFEDFESALHVQDGVEQPAQVNEAAVSRLKRAKRGLQSHEYYTEGILQGNRTILSQAITLVESAHPDHQAVAQEVIQHCLPHSGKGMRIGITGVPGVGKSTFIEAFGTFLTDSGKQVAVLAIDPSSQRSKGSILGDKTRMEKLAVDPKAFIRPSPSAGSLGGVARKTHESLILCEAAGFDVVLIETVGVGQSETAVHSMVDFFLLLMLPNAGDELQGIKRGIMEMADAILINKADGENVLQAQLARSQYELALHLFPPTESKWKPVVDICSARTGDGISRLWDTILQYHQVTNDNGYLQSKRLNQSLELMMQTIREGLLGDFFRDKQVMEVMKEVEKELRLNLISSYQAARKILEAYQPHIKQKEKGSLRE